MRVNELTKELIDAPGSHGVEVLITLEIEGQGTLFLKASADGAASSTTKDKFYISCHKIYAKGYLAIDPRNNRKQEG